MSPHRILSALLVAGAGLADAVYLTANHFLNRVPPCSLISGCETVTTSSYATFAGVPVALLGVLYYLTVIVLLLAYFDRQKITILRLATGLIALGVLFSAYLIYLQAAVLQAFCIYCLFSASITALLFLLIVCSRVVWQPSRSGKPNLPAASEQSPAEK